MSNVINKSNHPVEIKKISLSIWSLRDEIEAAISEKLKEHDGEGEVDIEDIKNYYTSILNREISDDDDEDEERQDNVDSSGNPMDEDAAAMMAALQGDGGDEEEADPEASEEESEEEEDDEAAKLAAEMLGDQAGAGEEDDEAAKLAAEMLDGQGGGDSDETETEERPKEFKRPTPEDDKVIEGFLMLSDINMETIMTFTKGPFLLGQNIVIRFNIPNSFILLASVTNCFDISRNSKIISKTKPSHRIHCQFEFKFPSERTTLRDFLKSIEPTIPAPPKKIKRPDSEDDDDDFDDLGF